MPVSREAFWYKGKPYILRHHKNGAYEVIRECIVLERFMKGKPESIQMIARARIDKLMKNLKHAI